MTQIHLHKLEWRRHYTTLTNELRAHNEIRDTISPILKSRSTSRETGTTPNFISTSRVTSLPRTAQLTFSASCTASSPSNSFGRRNTISSIVGSWLVAWPPMVSSSTMVGVSVSSHVRSCFCNSISPCSAQTLTMARRIISWLS